MTRDECTRFLQWALPKLGMRWSGFRKVRSQVCKRLKARLTELNLPHLDAYRKHLESDPAEWKVLEPLCRITITRFYRDKGVFDFLARDVLPCLADQSTHRGERTLRVWSAGCAGGEEPYTLSILWQCILAERFPRLNLKITATDIDPVLLSRAFTGRYRRSSIRDLPADLRARCFSEAGEEFVLQRKFKTPVEFIEQDIRRGMPAGPFDLVCCRNLAFTYFDDEEQRRILNGIAGTLVEGGALVLAPHESLPEGDKGFSHWGSPNIPVYRKKELGGI